MFSTSLEFSAFSDAEKAEHQRLEDELRQQKQASSFKEQLGQLNLKRYAKNAACQLLEKLFNEKSSAALAQFKFDRLQNQICIDIHAKPMTRENVKTILSPFIKDSEILSMEDRNELAFNKFTTVRISAATGITLLRSLQEAVPQAKTEFAPSRG